MSIKKKRREKEITQEGLAKMLGVTQQAVMNWESGRTRPRAALLPKLADILGCTVDELLREGGE